MDRNLKLLGGIVVSALLIAVAQPQAQQFAAEQAMLANGKDGPSAPASFNPRRSSDEPLVEPSPVAQAATSFESSATVYSASSAQPPRSTLGEPTMTGDPISGAQGVSGEPMFDPSPSLGGSASSNRDSSNDESRAIATLPSPSVGSN